MKKTRESHMHKRVMRESISLLHARGHMNEMVTIIGFRPFLVYCINVRRETYLLSAGGLHWQDFLGE